MGQRTGGAPPDPLRSSPAEVRWIVLVGPMGAGKTTVGHLVASRLGWSFVDGDASLERATGRRAREISTETGVDALHALEARVLLHALAGSDRTVIAAAASVVDDPGCRRALRRPGIAVVRLRARPETLARRSAGAGHRRGLGTDPVAAFREQSRARAARFGAVRPAVTVDVDDVPPGTVASLVLASLRPSLRRDGAGS